MNRDKDKYRLLIESLPDAFAYHQAITDEDGKPVDYIFLQVNPAFEEMTGLKREEITGKRVTEVLPGIEKDQFDWIGTCGRVAQGGKAIRFERFAEPLGRWYEVCAYSDEQGFFATVFRDITAQKEAEETIKQHETELTAIYENAPLVMMLFDKERKVRKINGYGTSFAGKPEEEMLGKRGGEALGCLNALDDPEGCGKGPHCQSCTVRRTVIETLETGQTRHQVEASLPFLMDGKEERLYFLLSTVRVALRGQQLVLVCLQDITDRKKAEESLQQEKAFQAILLDLATGFINVPPGEFDRAINDLLEKIGEFTGHDRVYLFRHDHRRRVTSNTHEWCREGVTPEIDNLQETPFDFYPDFLETWSKGEVVNIPKVARMPEEHIMRAIFLEQNIQSLALIPLMQDQVNTGFVGFDAVKECKSFSEQDIKLLRVLAEIIANAFTRNEAEEFLRASENRFRTFLENLPVGVYRITPGAEGEFLMANPAFLRMFGLKGEEELKKLKMYDLYHDPAEREKAVNRVIERGGYGISELKLRNKDGKVIYCLDTARLICDREGAPLYFDCVLEDITERKKAEEELRTLNEELEKRVKERTTRLEAANRELEAFTHSASHDLRGPLNRISGFSEALLEDYADRLDNQGIDCLQRINSSCEKMKLLIDDLLKLSRVSQMQISREPVELSALANVCLKELQAREPDRKVKTVITPGLIAEGDTALLRIALENLLENAWKYSAGRNPACIEFGSIVQEGKEVFYIRDNGTGFDMKYAEKVFTPFQRLHDAKTYPGTGVGLSIVSRIINRHGGEIWAEGEPGKGACFWFSLP